MRDELGDLLFQVVFHSQMAREQGSFGFDDVVAAICDKMERRHPHVFGDARIDSAAAQTVAWEEQKRLERERSGKSVLADVPLALPALTRANKLGKRAAQVGFEWPDVAGALDKLDEELGELRKGLSVQADQAHITDELGDVLFCVVNVCRYLGVDPETALKGANAKFERRFGYVEQRLREQGRSAERGDAGGDGQAVGRREGRRVTCSNYNRRIRRIRFILKRIQGSFMPFRLPCPPGSAHIQPGFGDIDA